MRETRVPSERHARSPCPRGCAGPHYLTREGAVCCIIYVKVKRVNYCNTISRGKQICLDRNITVFCDIFQQSQENCRCKDHIYSVEA